MIVKSLQNNIGRQYETLPADIVPLPSRGIIYGKDSFFHKKTHVEYMPMTVYCEDILLNSAFRKKNCTISKLIAASLSGDNINVKDLLVGDKDALMVAIRISGYGRLYEPVFTCPGCEEENHLKIDLASIKVKYLELEPKIPGENLFFITLPKSKIDVGFKFLSLEDETKIWSDKRNIEYSMVTTQLVNSIVEVNGRRDRANIEKFVSRLNARDSNYLRNYISSHEPGLDMNFDFECSHCQFSTNINIPRNHDFFSLDPSHREVMFLEPYFLLGYYFGMTFDEYYKMPLQYRRWIIERINKEIKAAAEANNEGGSQIPSKAAHHNTPDVRALAGKRPNVPAKLRRF